MVPNLSNICIIRIDLASNIYKYISKISMCCQVLLLSVIIRELIL
jgi:hypothetical protein